MSDGRVQNAVTNKQGEAPASTLRVAEAASMETRCITPTARSSVTQQRKEIMRDHKRRMLVALSRLAAPHELPS